MKTTLYAAAIALALVVPAAADRAEDDLAAVRKAVAGGPARPAAQATQATPRPAAEEEPALAPRRGAGPKWFRVRIVEKSGKGSRVSVNLPLGIVRAFAEDWPLPNCHRCASGHGPTVGEVLRSLDAGQSLVDIEDEDSTVRVWVD
jgi:hypothetical protein